MALVVWDVFDVRRALHLPNLSQVMAASLRRVWSLAKRAVLTAWHRIRRPQPIIVPLEGASLSLSGALATVHVRHRDRGTTLQETVDELWRVVTEAHDVELDSLRHALAAEMRNREGAVARETARLEAVIAEVERLVHRVSGTRHGWRIAGVILIVAGLGLAIAAVWLPGPTPTVVRTG